jgi:ABC-type multidrug transport system ATPase subunit/ABC-type multidrug transport system permease subunit
MLRMPQWMIDDERRARVQTVVTLLSLDQCIKTMISQLSGGERKRLAFATVLLTDPRVVLIDEPTSGLDSYLTRALMHMIRRMAVELRRTIIVVLHQPTSDLFNFVDSLCLLVHGGRQAFFGAIDEAPIFLSSECGLSAPSLESYIEQLATSPSTGEQTLHQGAMVADRFAQSVRAHVLIDSISTLVYQQPLDELESETVQTEEGVRYRSTFIRQVKWLLWRTWITDRYDPMRKTKFLIHTLFMSLVIGIIFFRLQTTDNQYEQNMNALSLIMFYAILESNMGLILIGIPAERARISRDWKQRTYSFHAYYLARWITDTCFIVLSSILYLSIVVFLVGMRGRLIVVTIKTLEVMTACGLASLVASLSSTPQTALLVLQPLQMMIGQFSGFYMNSHSIPGYIEWIRYVSYIHYGYKLMLITQWHNFSIPCDPLYAMIGRTTLRSDGQSTCIRTGDDILFFYGVDPNSFTVTVMLLTILGITFHFAAYTINLIHLRRIV